MSLGEPLLRSKINIKIYKYYKYKYFFLKNVGDPGGLQMTQFCQEDWAIFEPSNKEKYVKQINFKKATKNFPHKFGI